MSESTAHNIPSGDALPNRDGDKSTLAVHNFSDALWWVVHNLRSATSEEEVLSLIATAIADAGLYRRVVLTIHNEQGDITAIGYHGVPDEVIDAARHARRIPLETRQAMLDSANKISESYFVPCELGLDLSGEGRYVQSDEIPHPEGQWQPDDELFVPLHDAGGGTIGYASVDTPPNGKRPDLPTIRDLELFVCLASEALGRVLATHELDTVKSRFQRMITHANDVIYRVNIPENSFEYISPAIEELCGYTPEYIISRPVDALVGQIVHPDNREELLAVWGAQRSQSPIVNRVPAVIEFRIQHVNGDIRWAQVKNIILTDDDGQVIAVEGIIHDITKRHRLNEKLAEAERKYCLLAENARDLVYAQDTDGKLIYLSPSAERFLGVGADQAIGMSLSDWLIDDPVNRAAFEIFSAEVARGETVPPLMLEILSRDGQTFMMEFTGSLIRDEDGKILGVQGVGRDVTEYKRTEESLRKGERKFRELANLLPQTVFEIDLDGKLTFANQCALETFGYTQDDLARGLNVFPLFTAEDHERIRENMERLKLGQTPEGHIYTAIRKSGQTFPVRVYSSPIHDGEKLVGFRGVVVDLTELRQAEKDLRESEKLFRTLSTNIPGMIYRANPDWTTEILFNSDIISGYAVDKFSEEKMNWLDLIHPDDREQVLQETDQLSSGRMDILQEYRIINNNGKIRWIEDHKTPRFTDSGEFLGVDGVAFDVTERKCAEEALQESEEKWRSLVENAPHIIMIVDRDSTIRFVNHTVLGITVEDTIGKKLGDFTKPEYQDMVLKNTEQVFQTGETDSYEVEGVGPDGRDAWYETKVGPIKRDGQVVAATLIVTDITERKEVLEALRTSEGTARALMNATTEMACLLDPTGVILALNLGAAQQLGKNIDELIGVNVFGFFAPQVAESRKARLDEVVRTTNPIRFEDERDGKIFDSYLYPIFDADRNVERVASFTRDITERENMLRQLRRKSTELDRANSYLAEMVSELHRKNRRARELTDRFQAKNAELESLVFMLSHDLKTPLVSIRELTAIFRRRYSRLIDERGRDIARRISSNAKNTLQMVDSLLDYARADNYLESPDDFELGRLVDEIWERIVDAFPGRDAVLRRPEESISCRFSRMALERVLANLLRNAVTYVPEDRRPEIEIQWERTDDRLSVSILDNGIGIPAAEKDKIFELFYRAKPPVGEGSGVGLAVVKKIVDAVGGTIEVLTRSDGGTVFTVDLPLKTGKQQSLT